ncbi:MAG: hypothetical protein ABI171_16970 [Collimonas sp.]|uniref:hypothetical protein n=1 Tax=Collimonas sp. TaxID=1963772 RepID=UPI00326433E1
MAEMIGRCTKKQISASSTDSWKKNVPPAGAGGTNGGSTEDIGPDKVSVKGLLYFRKNRKGSSLEAESGQTIYYLIFIYFSRAEKIMN